MSEAEIQIGRVIATCYHCGQEFETYAGTMTVPPDPMMILQRIEDARGYGKPLDLGKFVKPVDVCSNPDCQWFEMKRQDALYQKALEPEIEKWKQIREDEKRRKHETR